MSSIYTIAIVTVGDFLNSDMWQQRDLGELDVLCSLSTTPRERRMGLASKVGGTQSGYYPGPLSSNYGYPPQLAAAQANQNQAGGGMPAGASASGYGAPTAAPQQQMPYPGQSGPPQPGSRRQ